MSDNARALLVFMGGGALLLGGAALAAVGIANAAFGHTRTGAICAVVGMTAAFAGAKTWGCL